MKNQTFYNYLGKIAIIVTPLAAAIAFGWSVYVATLTYTGNDALSRIAGVTTAVALESVGMLAGHIASDFYQQKDRRWFIAALIMLVYVAAGFYELRGTSVAVIFLISPLVYVLVAMQHTSAEQKTATAVSAQDDKLWKRKQSEARAQRKHQLELLKVERRFQAETAVSSKVSGNQPGNQREPERTVKETMATIWEPGMGPTELARLAGTSKGYASKYIRNGAMLDYEARVGGDA